MPNPTPAKVTELLAVTQGPWACFHCGDTFTDASSARLHFGGDEGSEAACKIKAGAEGSILRALREAETAAADAWFMVHNENSDIARAYAGFRSRHEQALRNAEELGYERGLADARAEALVASDGAGNLNARAWEALRAVAHMEGRTHAQTHWFGKMRDLLAEHDASTPAVSDGWRPTREDIARIIDPRNWTERSHYLVRADEWFEKGRPADDCLVGGYRQKGDEIVAESLAQADAILALQTLPAAPEGEAK